MLKRIGIYAGYTVLWCAIVADVVWAESLSRKHDTTHVVCATNIEISGGGNQPLIDDMAISNWLKKHAMHPEGLTLKSVDIAAIESIVEAHDAVAEADVHVSYDGTVEIEVVQREPVARLRIDGYDMYVTADGYLLPTTEGYAVRVPVVTGNYKPLFGSSFTGYANELMRDSIATLDRHIVALEESKIPLYNRLIDNNAELRTVKRDRAKKGLFTSEKEYEILLKAYKERRSIAQARHSTIERQIRGEIASITAEQEATRHSQTDIARQAAEFEALISFVKYILDDKFWCAEVVQIEATGGGSTPLQLAIVPRSGRFVVDLGETESLSKKLSTLRRFYDRGLDYVGWDRYRSISVRYDGQVVCR